MSREKLASLLWSDRGHEQALHSLRNALSALRKAFAGLNPCPLSTDRKEVSLEPAVVEVDAIEFAALVAAGTPEALVQACDLYRGDLLEGVKVKDPSFEEWLFYERQRYRDLALKAFERLLAHQQDRGEAAPAIETAQRLLQLNSAHEGAHRALMRLYAAQGRRSAALEQYKHCRSALQRELDVGPEPETDVLYQNILHRRVQQVEETSDLTGEASATEPANIPLPDKPSIAVLPFKNLVTDTQDDYFVDGLTETIIAELTRYPDLFVIASNSVFTYKGRAVKVQTVAQELGVRHVLEGSIQKSTDRVRVTAQLVDAVTGHHLWAQRYDSDLADVFALQDEIALKIVGTLATSYGGRLTKAWRKLGERKGETNLTAYDYLLRGEARFDALTQAAILEARHLWEKAIEIDPCYGRAHAKLAFTYIQAVYDGWAEFPGRAVERAEALARDAIRLDDSDPWGHWALGCVRIGLLMDYDKGLGDYERALELGPNDADVLVDYGWVLSFAGQPKKGIEQIDRAMRLNPHHPQWYLFGLGLAYHDARMYEQAISVLERGPVENPTLRLYLAASYGQLDRKEQAQKQVKAIQEAEPELSAEGLRPRAPYKHAKDFDHLLEGLRKAGLRL